MRKIHLTDFEESQDSLKVKLHSRRTSATCVTLKRRLIVARPETSHAMSDAKVYAAGFDNKNARGKKRERTARDERGKAGMR